jgi:signal transduction histidine kinase
MAMRALASITGRETRARRGVGPVAALVSSGLVLVTLEGSIREYRASPFELGLPAWLVAVALCGSLAIVGTAWIAGSDRPPAGVGLAIATVGLLVPVWAAWTTLSADARAYALAASPIALAGIAQVGLSWSPSAHNLRPLMAIYGLAGAAVVVHAAGYDPITDPGCTRTCESIQPLVGGLLSGHAAYALAAMLVGTAGLVAAVALIREARRRASSVVAWAALLAVVTVVVPWITHAISWADSLSRIADPLPAVMAGLLIGFVPLGAGIAARRVRSQIRDLVEHLPDGGLPRGSRTGGHVLDVQFAVTGEDRWVDRSGVEIGPEDGPAQGIVISDASGPALRLDVAPGGDPVEVAATLTPATMLALQNLRLAAVSRARLAEVRASQRRIVDASDAERQRIERDLHDGAQQRLVAASFQLSLAGRRLVAGGETLSRAEASVREALERLRLMGHGIFPATLTTEGLAAAIEDLARASDVPVTLDVPELDLERDVALAAYALVATVLARVTRHPGSARVEVGAATRDGSLELRVEVMGSVDLGQDDLVDASDRIGAVGGHLAIAPIDGGMAITAVVPCE